MRILFIALLLTASLTVRAEETLEERRIKLLEDKVAHLLKVQGQMQKHLDYSKASIDAIEDECPEDMKKRIWGRADYYRKVNLEVMKALEEGREEEAKRLIRDKAKNFEAIAGK